MRGAHRLGDEALHTVGIIPADAGSTIPMRQRLLGSRDHPRGCGEHAMSLVINCMVILSGMGIIPADAGSTDPDEWEAFAQKDHPRGCGEHRQCQPSIRY